jgi:hypothetical protein
MGIRMSITPSYCLPVKIGQLLQVENYIAQCLRVPASRQTRFHDI